MVSKSELEKAVLQRETDIILSFYIDGSSQNSNEHHQKPYDQP